MRHVLKYIQRDGSLVHYMKVALKFGSTSVLFVIGTIAGMGIYVGYKEFTRYHRMMIQFSRGNILQPMKGECQVDYFQREQEEQRLLKILKSEPTNQYYLIFGEVGTGKTRLITRIVQQMIKENGTKMEGAPIYVLASQGDSFPDSFGNAVNFHFDEHISFKFMLDYLFRVGDVPKRDDQAKIERILNAMEIAGFIHLQKTGKPVVLVIDGVDWITGNMPGVLESLQEKAKLWADTNIVKVVLVSNDEKTEYTLQKNQSGWSRGAGPIFIGDLPLDQAEAFLQRQDKGLHSCHRHFECDFGCSFKIKPMPKSHMEKILNLVGGRMHNLLIFKLDWLLGIPFEQTANTMKIKERSKFLEVTKQTELSKVIQILLKAPHRQVPLISLIDMTSKEVVQLLALKNILKIERDDESGLFVKFQSRLTEVVMEDMFEQKVQKKTDVSLKKDSQISSKE